MKTFIVPILSIQPTQLFINEQKLTDIQNIIREKRFVMEPIPIKVINGKYCFVDGHTRAYALYQSGIREITVYEELDTLDWHLYEHCIEWCANENITSIADFHERIIPKDTYETIWIARCGQLQKEHGASLRSN